MTTTSYRHTPAMGEISGMGDMHDGGKAYEAACQDMLDAGVRWLLALGCPAELRLRGYKGVYGVVEPDSDDACALSEVVGAASPGCTGAMHQAVMERLLFINTNGWDAYCAELTAARAKKEER